MKKVILILTFIIAVACGSDCEINSQKISEYAAEINVLQGKIDEAIAQVEQYIKEKDSENWKKKLIELQKKLK